MIQPGTYKHYKGNLYQVIGVAKEADEDEMRVVYIPLYPSPYPLFTRSPEQFNESVGVDGKLVKRFERVDQ